MSRLAATGFGLCVNAASYSRPRTFTGLIQAARQSELSFKRAEELVAVLVEQGARARAADPSAVREVVVHSTRHVVSTSLTTMAGFAPLVIAGGGFWPPLAVTIAGGVGGATILALYFVPSAYILVMCPGGCAERAKETVPRIVESTPLAAPAFVTN